MKSTSRGYDRSLAVIVFALGTALPATALTIDDTCSTAVLISPVAGGWSILPNRSLSAADSVDHYRATLEPGYEVRLWCSFSQADGNLDMRLWNSDCSVLLASSTSSTDDELISWMNSSATPVEVVCEVFLVGSGAVQYDFLSSKELVDCLATDQWEENDTCATPTVIPFSVYLFEPGLTVAQNDDDFYQFTVPAYAQLTATIQYDRSGGDIDAALYDAGCGTLLQVSATSENESFVLDNFSAAPRTYVIHVYLADTSPCEDYTLRFLGQPGSSYCTSVPNSTGQATQVHGWGSASVAANDLALFVETVPFKQMGIIFYGPNATSMPFGNGTLCVSQSVVRSSVMQAFKGTYAWYPDYAALASSAHPIVPGALYNFQCWYRDPAAGGAFFNLSDGYRIAFHP